METLVIADISALESETLNSSSILALMETWVKLFHSARCCID